MSKMPNVFVDVRLDLVYAYGQPSNEPRSEHTPYFDYFSCAIAHHFLGDPHSDVKNAKFFHERPSRPCLCIRLAIMAWLTHLEGQTSPEASMRLISTIFVQHSIFWVIRILMSKMPNFFVDVRHDLVYAYGWPSRPVRPIWKVKRAPKQAYPSFRRFSCAIAHHFLGDPNSNVNNGKCFHGRPLRPCLCIRLAIMACTTNLEGQTSPEASILLISTIFV